MIDSAAAQITNDPDFAVPHAGTLVARAVLQNKTIAEWSERR